MKKLIISLIVLFASFEITFAITGVWQLDKKILKQESLKKCEKILEIFAKTKQKNVANKYAENYMKMAVILSTITAGNIVNIKKDGLVDFYGPKPFSKDIKKRKSVVIDFKGGDSSVYSEIAPHFSVKF